MAKKYNIGGCFTDYGGVFLLNTSVETVGTSCQTLPEGSFNDLVPPID